jgi:hypothetical protein
MKKITSLFLVAACFIVLIAAAATQTNDLAKAEWLIGTWENKTQKGSIYETWHKVNDTTLAGKSYIIKEKDPVVFENIQIVQEQARLLYIPTVKDQNEGLPVRFMAKTVSGTQLVFENQQHDFPQMISYTKINSDSLVAEISGIKNGRERRQIFPMKRVK